VEVSHVFQNFLSTGSGQNALAEALKDGFAKIKPNGSSSTQSSMSLQSRPNRTYPIRIASILGRVSAGV